MLSTYSYCNGYTIYVLDTLAKMKPPFVGVTGPAAGKKEILIFDFVHKTHVDIFGFYYPVEFPGNKQYL